MRRAGLSSITSGVLATVLAALAMPTGAWAQAGTPTPVYKPLRYDEDYRYLAGPAARPDIWDPVKYIRLGENPLTFVSFGGELWERFEYYSAPDFGLHGGGADAYLLHRLLLYADVHFGDTLRGFIQFGNQFAPGKDAASAVYVDQLDLQQGFIDLKLPLAPALEPVFRAGRQEMAFGSQRLVSIRDAPNVRRSFDGFRLGGTIGGVRIDTFLTRPVLLTKGVFGDHPNHDQAFWGAYGTAEVLGPNLRTDFYYLGFENDRARYGAVSGREHRHSIGMRLFGTGAGWDWDWEALGQFGTFAGQTIHAWTVSTNTGYTITDLPAGPRIGLKADVASGDHHASNGSLGTFNGLFPKLAYFNQAALLAPANIIDIQPTLTVKPVSNLTATLGWDFAWRETNNDAVYIEPFSAVRGTAGRGGSFIGHQIALEISSRLTQHVELLASYVHFSAGDALRVSGGRRVDFGTVSVAYKF